MRVNEVSSEHFKSWVTNMDPRACIECKLLNGKIYYMHEEPDPMPPIHPNGRCRIEALGALYAGDATEKGIDGADWYLERYRQLPDYYITKKEAKNMGWDRRKANLHKVAPGMMIMGGIYRNKNGHLPSAPGRIWYEADINYAGGRRNTERIVYFNDGLIFVTYDHYHTFYEII